MQEEKRVSQCWHILTGEYPPRLGGVADYSRSVARGLAAAGDEVHVWAPRGCGPAPADAGVRVRQLPGNFDPLSLTELDRALARLPGRVLLQYTPHAFGFKAMNLPLCAWLWARRRPLDVMFHEVAYPFLPGQPLKHRLLAGVHRGMAALLLWAAERVFISTPGWRNLLARVPESFPEPVWSPVPSNLAEECPEDQVQALRARLRPLARGWLVGHFGTYGRQVTQFLEPALTELLSVGPSVTTVLLGKGSNEFAMTLGRKYPGLVGRLLVVGELDAAKAACHIAACDVMLQPYMGGINSRRGSAMAALALGRAVVTNEAEWSEPFWRTSGAVAVAPAGGLAAAVRALLDDESRRVDLGRTAAALYRSSFAIEHTIRQLRQTVPAFPEPAAA
jgi:glycosyltransferase involved in cell wall biosynthesis